MGGTTVGLVHPGEMGSAVGAALRVGGHRVVWASAGRSSATRARATADGLEEMTTLAALADSAPVIFSICPPHAARDVAREFVALGYRGLFVDANAVAPATARETGRRVAAAGARFVDGGIIGPPPRRPGPARPYLPGYGTSTVAELLA